MTLNTVLTLLACVTALLLSIGALVVAVHSWRLSNSRSSVALSARVSEIESTTEALTAKVKGLNSRLSMQLLREKRLAQTAETEQSEPEDADAAAKRVRDDLNSSLAQRKFL